MSTCAQSEFLVLLEDAIRMPDLVKCMQRYQLAVDQAKFRLNLAVAPGALLMPARMINITQKHNRLHQQIETGNSWSDETRSQQRSKSRNKKNGPSADGGRPLKNQPTKATACPYTAGCPSSSFRRAKKTSSMRSTKRPSLLVQ